MIMNVSRTPSGFWTAAFVLAALLLTPGAAHAEDFEPLSPAVARVLAKADADIRQIEKSDFVARYLDSAADAWIGDALSTVTAPLDTEQDVVRQRENIFSQTACFRYDENVLEWKMDDIRQKLDEAVKEKSVTKILPLEEVYKSLTEALRSLQRSGLRPDIREDAGQAVSSSSPADGAEKDVAATSCFFHSDYAPASVAGYGCDAQTLGWIIERIPQDAAGFRADVAAELEAMTAAENILAGQNGAEELFRQIIQHVDVFVTSDPTATAGELDEEPVDPLPTREHKVQAGCVDVVEPGVLLHPLRGPFDVDPDEGKLATDFRTLRMKFDEQRPLSELYRPPESIFSFSFVPPDVPGLVRTFTSQQTAWESATFAAGADPLLAVEDTFADLRTAVRTLIRLGNSLDGGLRGFVRDFAYFLRRTCLDRPCNARLDTVLKFVFADACFAYGNGEYKNATPENPQWQKCVEEAGL